MLAEKEAIIPPQDRNQQRRIQDRRIGRAPLGLKIFWVCFCNFGLYNMHIIYFNCSQHAMLSICFYTLLSLQKTDLKYVKLGTSKQFQNPGTRILPCRDRAPWFWNFWINPAMYVHERIKWIDQLSLSMSARYIWSDTLYIYVHQQSTFLQTVYPMAWGLK